MLWGVVDKMTDKTALYRHYDARGKLLYIGISLSAVQRLKQHVGDKEWASEIASVKIEQHDTRDAALKAEAEAIKAERPRWNVKHNTAQNRDLWAEAREYLEVRGVLRDYMPDEE